MRSISTLLLKACHKNKISKDCIEIRNVTLPSRYLYPSGKRQTPRGHWTLSRLISVYRGSIIL